MSSDIVKPWEKSWSTEEIIKNAPNWSLAGDAGLLKHLESFSKNLFSKAEETNNNLNKLLSDLNNASLSLEETKNEFRALRNTQFIESRVYEDDETVQEEIKGHDEHVQRKTKEEKMKDVQEAILGGISVVEKYFEKVEVPGSDSEDETDFTSFVLKPKDPYVDRPLPFLIGTDEWYKKWHVGLLDSSSESEDDKLSEKSSDVDSISELSYDGNKVNEIPSYNRPVANSTFNESIKPQLDLFGDSDNENTDSTSDYVSAANRNFANELATKLGRYVDEPEINKKPINTNVSVRQYGNLFSDEPPPIDDFNENNNGKGLFSGGEGLFDNLDDNVNLWNEEPQKKTEKSSFKNLFDEDNDLFSNTISDNSSPSNVKDVSTTEVTSRGLFDDEDDDLFNDNLSKIISKRPSPYLPPAKTTSMPYFANEPPELEPSVSTETKKPFGGVKLIEQSDLDRLRKGRQSSSDTLEDKNSPSLITKDSKKNESVSASIIKTEIVKKPKKLSLFDDDEDDEQALFEKDLFSTISSLDPNSTKATGNEDLETEDKPKLTSLFDDSGDNDNLFTTSVIKSEQNESMHDAYQTPPENDSISNIPPLSNVFDSNQPELDDYWDTPSDNVFDDGGLFDNVQEISSQRSGLFDNEPPSLFCESSGIVRDISRVGNDESFSPHATSSRRFSTDIFNEQQSNDSFFVTKNKSQFEHQHVQSSLEIIPETSYTQGNDITSESILEITPSGDVNSLYSDSTTSCFDNAQNKTDNIINIEKDKESKVTVDIEEVNESDAVLSKFDSPGKLKHNLKINVSALIPGASPPKKKQLEKSNSLEDVTRTSVTPTDTKDNLTTAMYGNSEVLPSITKDRVRIPVKRRPSTRKARQESLRNSVPDFGILSVAGDEVKIVTDPKVENEPKSEFIDIFEDNLVTPHRQVAVNLFDDCMDSDSPLFSSNITEKTDSKLSTVNQVTSIIEVQPKDTVIDELKQPHINSDSFESEDYKQLSLFDDAEEFDDIFSSNKLPPKSNILKESLFDDDDLDDDDDIFGSSLTFKRDSKIKGDTSLVKGAKKPTQVKKKLENSKVMDDPLSSFLND